VTYTAFAVPLSLVLSMVMALGVRRAFRGARFFRSIFFLPVITSLVLAGSIFVWIFSANGPWGALMAPLGFGGSWLGSTALVVPAIVLVGVWSRFGYGMMIMIAALQDVPRELEEAALMDGAGAWQRFRWIILPYLRPTIFFLAVIETTFAFQVFDVIYVMTQGGPANASYSLVYMLYDQGFRYFDYGYAAAVGVALFIMTLVVALIQRLVIGKKK
jgi:multiple sugar transport system permease protein